MALNDKQLKFCSEYMKHGNAAKAYRTAYPDATDATAQTNSSKILGNTHVAEKIAELRKQTAKDSKITRERVAAELAEMGFTSVDVANLKHGDKLKALELLAKMLGFLDGPGDKSDSKDAVRRLSDALDEVERRRAGRFGKS